MKGELAAVASQYAEAVLELAEQADKSGQVAEQIMSDLKGINQSFAATPEIQIVLSHPGVAPEEKTTLLLKVFEGKVGDITYRLLRLLADRRRLELLKEIENKYAALLRVRNNIVSARLSSSKELTQSEVADIKARLTEHLGKKLELDVEVDKTLLGGVVLRLGDQIIDGSLKGKLAAIEKQLLAV